MKIEMSLNCYLELVEQWPEVFLKQFDCKL